MHDTECTDPATEHGATAAEGAACELDASIAVTGDAASGPARGPAVDSAPDSAVPPEPVAPRPREIGGRKGPDPTRYGDWEKNGRCIDF